MHTCEAGAFARLRFLLRYRAYTLQRDSVYSFVYRSSSLFPSERTAGLWVDRVEGSKKRQKRRLSGELWSKSERREETRGGKERVSARVCRSVRSLGSIEGVSETRDVRAFDAREWDSRRSSAGLGGHAGVDREIRDVPTPRRSPTEDFNNVSSPSLLFLNDLNLQERLDLFTWTLFQILLSSLRATCLRGVS